MAKLSPKQQTALNRLREEFNHSPNAWYSAYDLKQSLATLSALETRGLIQRRSGLGSSFCPRNSITFRFKPPTVSFIHVGNSVDHRTSKWRVTCVECEKNFIPVTTLLATQTFDCPDCGASYFADWNKPEVKALANG